MKAVLCFRSQLTTFMTFFFNKFLYCVHSVLRYSHVTSDQLLLFILVIDVESRRHFQIFNVFSGPHFKG